MQKALKGLIWMLLLSVTATAQTPRGVTLLHYALDSFTAGTVLLKNGTTTPAVLNYNTLTGEMIFVTNGKYLALAVPQDVDTVFIAQRRFVPVANKFCEWLGGTQPALFKEYTCTVKDPGTNAGFGKTNTTAATSLNTLVRSGGAYELSLPADFELLPATAYYLRSKGKFYKLANAQAASKAIPAKKAVIEEWLKTHPSKFSTQEEVVQFVQAIQEKN